MSTPLGCLFGETLAFLDGVPDGPRWGEGPFTSGLQTFSTEGLLSGRKPTVL
jgi:hypothetical protein